MSEEKKHVTFNVSVGVKKDFQMEVINNGSDMSTVVEMLMQNYTVASRKIKASAIKPEIPLMEGREEETSSRLEFKDESGRGN